MFLVFAVSLFKILEEKVTIMQTVITKELGVINNQLRAVRRHVRLVGENLSFEIAIKRFEIEPRRLALCGECAFAHIIIFAPTGCEDLKNIRSQQIVCKKGEDIWLEAACPNFAVLPAQS